MTSKWTKKFDFNNIKNQMKKQEEEQKKYSNKVDHRFWKFTVGSDHTGSALIRFLPDPDNGTTWRKYQSHWFQYDDNGTPKSYVHNCAVSIGKRCIVCEKVPEYFKSDYENQKQLGKERVAKKKFVSNILVIKDPTNSENEGKVFLYDYGPMIQKMYKAEMFGDETETDELDDSPKKETYCPADFTEGANFLLKASHQKIGKRDAHTYSNSKFLKQSKLFNELSGKEWEAAIDGLMNQCHKTAEYPPSNTFPSDEEVLRKLAVEFGIVRDNEYSNVNETANDEDDWDSETQEQESTEKVTPSASADDDDEWIDNNL